MFRGAEEIIIDDCFTNHYLCNQKGIHILDWSPCKCRYFDTHTSFHKAFLKKRNHEVSHTKIRTQEA